MSFFPRMILIGASLAVGVIGIFAAKLLLGLMSKVWVVLIVSLAGFFLVWIVIKLNSPLKARPGK